MTAESHSLPPSGPPPSSDRRLRLFISYSRDDSVFATELEGGLKLLGYDVFIDRHLGGGEAWKQSLANHIAQADTIVFVLTPSSARSEMCHWEVERATSLSKRILPVVAKDVGEEPVPERLRELNYIFFTPPNSFVGKLIELRDALDKNLEWIREHTRYLDLAARWAAATEGSTPTGRLLVARSDIEAALKWLADWQRPNPEPTQLQRAFIEASAAHAAAEADARQKAIEERERLAREREDAAARAFAEAQRAEAAAKEAEYAQRDREAALAQAEMSARKTAELQKVARAFLYGFLALLIILLGYGWRQARETEKRETAVFTQLAAIAMNEGFYDRAMRYAVNAIPSSGCLFCSASHEVTGRLALSASMSALYRVIRLPEGRSATTVALHPGARTMLVGGYGGIVVFQKLEGHIENRVVHRHEGMVHRTGYSQDGRFAFTATNSGEVKIFDGESGSVLHDLKLGRTWVSIGEFSPDGELLVLGTAGGAVHLVDVVSGRKFEPLDGHKGVIVSISFDASGRRFATASQDGVRLWDVRSRDLVRHFATEGSIVSAAAINNAGTVIVAGSIDGRIVVWDVSGGAARLNFGTDMRFVRAIRFSPTGDLFYVSSSMQHIGIWNTETGAASAVLSGHRAGISAMLPVVDRGTMFTASYDGTIRRWRLDEGVSDLTLHGHLSPVTSLAASRDGRVVATVSENGGARLWTVADGYGRNAFGEDAGINQTAVSKDGRLLFAVGGDGESFAWALGEGDPKRLTASFPKQISEAHFSADGQKLLIKTSDSINLLDSGSFVVELKIANAGEPPSAIAVSSEGRWIAAGFGNGGEDKTVVVVWDARSGAAVARIEGFPAEIQHIAFSPDGKVLAAAALQYATRDATSKGGVTVISTESWKPISVLGAGVPSTAVVFSPNGKFLAAIQGNVVARGGRDAVTIWETAAWREHLVISSPSEPFASVGFVRDGRHLATGGHDNSLRLWEVEGGRPIGQIGSYKFPIVEVTASNDADNVVFKDGAGRIGISNISWLSLYGPTLRDRVCAEKLIGAQEFTDEELADPILRGIDPKDPVARNPCLRRGPLSFDYWTRLPGQMWRSLRP